MIKDLQNLRHLFDFSNLDLNHQLFSNENKKVVGKFKIETPNSIWIDEFIALRSKAYSFKCGEQTENKLKGITKPQTKCIKFEEYKNCLSGGEFNDKCNNYLLRSIKHNMFLQKVEKKSLNAFDEKRCYLTSTESIPWN